MPEADRGQTTLYLSNHVRGIRCEACVSFLCRKTVYLRMYVLMLCKCCAALRFKVIKYTDY